MDQLVVIAGGPAGGEIGMDQLVMAQLVVVTSWLYCIGGPADVIGGPAGDIGGPAGDIGGPAGGENGVYAGGVLASRDQLVKMVDQLVVAMECSA